MLFAASIYAAPYQVPVERIKTEVENYIREKLAQSGYGYQIDWLKNLRPVKLNTVPDSMAVSDRGGDPLMGKEVLQIRFFKNERVLRAVYLPVMLHVFGKVWQAVRPIPPEHEITADDVQLVDTDLSLLNYQPITGAETPVGKMSARPIKNGAVLYQKDVRLPYLVKKGETVAVSYRNGSLKIQLDAIAMQSGSAGEIIWVKNPVSKKRLKVKVAGKNRAVLP